MEPSINYVPIFGAILGGLIAGTAGISTALFMFHTQLRAKRKAIVLALIGEHLILAFRLLHEVSLLERGIENYQASGAAIKAIRSKKSPDRFVLKHVVGELGNLGPAAVYHLMETDLVFSQMDDERESYIKLHYLEEGADTGYSKNLLRHWREAAVLLANSLSYLANETDGLDRKTEEIIFRFLPQLVAGCDDASLEPIVLDWVVRARRSPASIDASSWTGATPVV